MGKQPLTQWGQTIQAGLTPPEAPVSRPQHRAEGVMPLSGLRKILSLIAIYSIPIFAMFHAVYSPEGIIAVTTNGRILSSLDKWRVTSFRGDSNYYLRQAAGHTSIAPYRYRPVVPLLVGRLGIQPVYGFGAVNILILLATVLLFHHWLETFWRFPKFKALAGGLLFLTLPGVMTTAPYPMVDIGTLFFAMLGAYAITGRRWGWFGLAVIGGILTKEILVILGLWWACYWWHKGIVERVLVITFPVVIFAGARAWWGGAVFEANYGYNLLAGQIPSDYALRMTDSYRAGIVLLGIFASFYFAWVGIINKHPFIRRSLPIIALVIVATVTLSSHITRPLGVLFPVVIPGFLGLMVKYP